MADADTAVASKRRRIAHVITDMLSTVLAQRNANLADAFMVFDKNGDGLLSTEEFQAGLAKLGISLPEAVITELVASMDTTGSGAINFTEVNTHNLP